MDLSSGKTYWDHTYKGFTYPVLENDVECDVLIVGSGSSGAHCAYFLADQGVSVTLVDKRTIASGSTVANTGLLQYSNDKMLSAMIRSFGEKAAVRHYQLGLEAIQTLNEEVVPSLAENSDFKIRKSLYFASSKEDVASLQEEFKTLKKYGFPADYFTKSQIEKYFSFSKEGAIVTGNDAEVNPYKHAHLLIHYAEQKGVKIYEHTKINGRKHTKEGDILYTDKGHSIKAKYIIYATGYEAQEEVRDPNGSIISSYALATNPVGNIDGWYDDMMLWETARPYIYARRTADGRIVFGGLDEATTKVDKRDTKLIHKRDLLMQTIYDMFPELKGKTMAEYYWGAFFGETHDGLPTIGTYEDYPNSYFLRGYGGNGTVYSVILSQIIRDLILKGKNDNSYIYLKERPMLERIM
ncbi:NAD(P)/FAD-dependent oxidoreductase [Bacillus testis]|uniref:NAD(P)/FAD-dependent oxidoreductase n=1 Tax=Bacillus testis TaxID=1622072 RepID=UPI00067EB674|nr:FAD-dependent oxidoreductase [Bacillus testis]